MCYVHFIFMVKLGAALASNVPLGSDIILLHTGIKQRNVPVNYLKVFPSMPAGS